MLILYVPFPLLFYLFHDQVTSFLAVDQLSFTIGLVADQAASTYVYTGLYVFLAFIVTCMCPWGLFVHVYYNVFMVYVYTHGLQLAMTVRCFM